MTDEPKEIETTVIDYLSEFLERVELFDLVGTTPLFRGQSVKRNLIPSIARLDNTADTTSEEKYILNQLRLQGASLIDPKSSDLDLLIQAQHFGLRTRLLDWTANPLVALWFACSVSKKGNAYIYALESDALMKESIPDPFAPSRTYVVQPPMNNPRIVAQQGWFTLHNYSKKAAQFVPLERNPRIANKLHEFEIPHDRIEYFIVTLDRLGVNAKTLFPDVAGLCEHLNWIHYKQFGFLRV